MKFSTWQGKKFNFLNETCPWFSITRNLGFKLAITSFSWAKSSKEMGCDLPIDKDLKELVARLTYLLSQHLLLHTPSMFSVMWFMYHQSFIGWELIMTWNIWKWRQVGGSRSKITLRKTVAALWMWIGFMTSFFVILTSIISWGKFGTWSAKQTVVACNIVINPSSLFFTLIGSQH